jgi:uncharacterized protein
MDNPFSFSGIVTGAGFCNREQEQKDLVNYITNAQNVLLYGNRRMGKTSLIHQVFAQLEKETLKLHIDLYGTVREEDFITAIMKNAGRLESRTDKLLKTVKELFTSANVSLSFDPLTGFPSLTPVFGSLNKTVYLEQVMAMVEHYSAKKNMVIVFDEFQEIENYSKGEFEKRLRGIVQTHSRISYIFAGSKPHILAGMFHSKGKAFYKLAQSYPLPEIDEAAYLDWIKGLFRKHKSISEKMILEVVNLCEKHPLYIQQFFYYLWDSDLSIPDIIESTLRKILTLNENEFITLWDTLTLNQCKTLKLLVLTEGKEIYSADSLQSVGLSTPSQVTKALESLMKKEIVVKNGNYGIQDIMFKQWILRL